LFKSLGENCDGEGQHAYWFNFTVASHQFLLLEKTFVKIKSASGIACFVKDRKKTVSFYETLGFETKKQDAKHATFYLLQGAIGNSSSATPTCINWSSSRENKRMRQYEPVRVISAYNIKLLTPNSHDHKSIRPKKTFSISLNFIMSLEAYHVG
jgi:hypothetical protein